ncbi:MAG: NUMOD4 motif-containing HNH endonuclease [Clostridia bacterium]|nr:NUMOD4 motif-containing HNH endonuclease [Clostridia bacterium]
MEKWKSIKNYEGIYEVSDLGRIRRIEGTVKSGLKNSGYKTVHSCILKQASKKNGYLTVDLSKNKVVKTISVHRIVAEAFCEKDSEEKIVVDHINCNKHDNRAINLEWVTPKENRDRAKSNKLYVNYHKKTVHCEQLNMTFESSFQAAEYLNQNYFKNTKVIKKVANKIRCCCNGLQNKAYGFSWKYVEDSTTNP